MGLTVVLKTVPETEDVGESQESYFKAAFTLTSTSQVQLTYVPATICPLAVFIFLGRLAVFSI